MIHYTITSGHSRESARSEVHDSVVEKMKPLTIPGRHRLPEPFEAYDVVVPETEHGIVFTVFHGSTPLVTCGGADTDAAADEVWPAMEKLYQQVPFGKSPIQPRSLPWLAVLLLSVDSMAAFEWLGDFERCLFWAWMEGK